MKDAETQQNVALSGRLKPSKFASGRTASSIREPPVESFVTGPAIPPVVHHNLPRYFGAYEALIDTLDRYPDHLVDVSYWEFDTNAATCGRHADAREAR
jgi:hypothetical protein